MYFKQSEIKAFSTLNKEFYEFPRSKKYFLWHTSCKVGSNLLIFRKNIPSCCAEAELFDMKSKKISDLKIKNKRVYTAAACYLNKVRVISGRLFDEEYKTLNTMRVFDPIAKTQSLSPVGMTQARKDNRVVVHKNKLFVFGVVDKDDKPLSSVETCLPSW